MVSIEEILLIVKPYRIDLLREVDKIKALFLYDLGGPVDSLMPVKGLLCVEYMRELRKYYMRDLRLFANLAESSRREVSRSRFCTSALCL